MHAHGERNPVFVKHGARAHTHTRTRTRAQRQVLIQTFTCACIHGLAWMQFPPAIFSDSSGTKLVDFLEVQIPRLMVRFLYSHVGTTFTKSC